jgi:hypothetical protein
MYSNDDLRGQLKKTRDQNELHNRQVKAFWAVQSVLYWFYNSSPSTLSNAIYR